jgi:predicted PurR-regulated permease PerM
VNDDDRSLKLSASNEELVVLVIRIVCLGLLGYWSLILIRPFLTIIVWSIIITVALYPSIGSRQNFTAIAHLRRLQLLFSPFSSCSVQ